jgi:hypothetical protein
MDFLLQKVKFLLDLQTLEYRWQGPGQSNSLTLSISLLKVPVFKELDQTRQAHQKMFCIYSQQGLIPRGYFVLKLVSLEGDTGTAGRS